MGTKHKFNGEIENAGGGGAFVRIPFDVEQAFGSKRPKVKAAIDGEPYRGTLVRMGGPEYILIILKEIREKIGKGFGDEVAVTVEEDVTPRRVEVPVDFQQALDGNLAAKAAYEKMSYTHQKEFARAILEAKRESTRRSRIAKAVEMLRTK